MPRNYRNHRKSKRKRRRRGSNVTKGTIVAINRSPFPPSLIVKQRYCTSVNIDAGVATPGYHVFNATGLYDPDTTGVGHQPLMFDVYSSMYDHYTVLGAKLTAKFAGGSNGVIVGCYVNDDASPITTYDTIMEQGEAVSSMLGYSAGYSKATISKKFSTKRFFGMQDLSDSDKLKGSSSGNPTDNAYFVVFVQSPNSATNPGAVDAVISIEYIVKWSEPTSQTQS